MGAGDFRSVFFHRRLQVPLTRSAQFQPQSITSAEEMRPSELVQQTDQAAPTARGGDTACRKGVRYGECRKNHAANIGGYAVDGCGEFMACGEEGTAAAMECAACNCHRDFHRREAEKETLCEYHRIRR